MSDQVHKPEPWHTDTDYQDGAIGHFVIDSDGGTVCGRDVSPGEAEARRIVACVNACLGISTSDLETAAEIGVMPPMEKIKGLQKRLAELQAALSYQSQASLDVMAERRRQIEEEGYDTAHDDEHVSDEIAALATFYVMPLYARDWLLADNWAIGSAIVPKGWSAKAGDRRRDLVKGCALAMAEIERIDRAEAAING